MVGTPPPRGNGFTLVEVLVALVVLSVAVVAVLQLFGGGLRLARASGDHLEATLLASTMLSELAWGPLEEGTTEGTEGEYRWSRRVTVDPELLPQEPDPGKPEAARLARVSVDVRWGKNRHVELVTIRPLTENVVGPVPSNAQAPPPVPGSSPLQRGSPFPGGNPFSGGGAFPGTGPLPGAGR